MERYEAVGKKVIARYEELTGQQARGTSKVESGRTSDTGGATAGKSFSSLPPEAKAACASFAKDLVGKGKTYAKLEDWQKKYAADYYGIA